MSQPRAGGRLMLVVAALAAVAAGGWLAAGRPGLSDPTPARAAGGPAGIIPVTVEVVNPRPGGIDRVCSQPGTVEPFEGANLYAKVSGFLAEQSVDIGTRVKRDQVLAKLSVPEFEKAVERDEAKLVNAKAKVAQAEARLVSVTADAKASKALVAFAEAEVKAKSAYTVFRRKQLERFRQLNDQQAIDARVVDENEDRFEAAQGAEFAAKEQVANARAQSESAVARITSAKADVDEAKAEVAVAAADLDKSKVWVSYTVITSPYDGVISKRSFYRGDFVRAAEAGGAGVPILAVDRTDLMRIVVPVPDRDVPFVTVGDPATLEVDAIPGRTFDAVVSRFADSEDLATRTMRTEVDMPNPDGSLRRGMYGKLHILLEKGTEGAVRVPTAALVSRTGVHRATVRIVRSGKALTVPVTVGPDNGIDIEVQAGLSIGDPVILRTTSPVDDGTPVTVAPLAAGGGH